MNEKILDLHQYWLTNILNQCSFKTDVLKKVSNATGSAIFTPESHSKFDKLINDKLIHIKAYTPDEFTIEVLEKAYQCYLNLLERARSENLLKESQDDFEREEILKNCLKMSSIDLVYQYIKKDLISQNVDFKPSRISFQRDESQYIYDVKFFENLSKHSFEIDSKILNKIKMTKNMLELLDHHVKIFSADTSNPFGNTTSITISPEALSNAPHMKFLREFTLMLIKVSGLIASEFNSRFTSTLIWSSDTVNLLKIPEGKNSLSCVDGGGNGRIFSLVIPTRKSYVKISKDTWKIQVGQGFWVFVDSGLSYEIVKDEQSDYDGYFFVLYFSGRVR